MMRLIMLIGLFCLMVPLRSSSQVSVIDKPIRLIDRSLEDKNEPINRMLTAEIPLDTTGRLCPQLAIDIGEGIARFTVDFRCLTFPVETYASSAYYRDSLNRWTITSDRMTHKVYPLEGDNLEWEVVLEQHPRITRLTFPMRYENLLFIYQDSLSDTDKSSAHRPDSVSHSYAVFYRYPTELSGGSSRYAKAFHIYRPRIWDRAGDTVWGSLEIDTVLQLINLEIPRLFLDRAQYPVTVDPTIGNSSLGASDYVVSDFSKLVNWFQVDTVVTSGILDSAFIGLRTVIKMNEEDDISVALYEYDPNLAYCDSVAHVTWGRKPDGLYSWAQAAFSSGSVSAGTDYVVAFSLDNKNISNNLRILYDDLGGAWGETKYLGSQTDLIWPVTLTSFSDHASRAYSIYLTYKSGSTEVKRRRVTSAQ